MVTVAVVFGILLIVIALGLGGFLAFCYYKNFILAISEDKRKTDLENRKLDFEITKYNNEIKLQNKKLEQAKIDEAKKKEMREASEAEHKAFYDLLSDPTKLWEDAVNGTKGNN